MYCQPAASRFSGISDQVSHGAGTDTLRQQAGISARPEARPRFTGATGRRQRRQRHPLRELRCGQCTGQKPFESIELDDGGTLSYADLLAQGFDLTGTAGNDVISGTSVDDRIDGGAGGLCLSSDLRGRITAVRSGCRTRRAAIALKGSPAEWKSRRWRDGGWNQNGTSTNDAEFEFRRQR